LARRAQDELGSIDILVNNAGVGVGGAQTTVADTDVGREVFETNYWSPLALQKSLVPEMVRRDRGAVVNVTSLGQVMTWPGLGHYSSTKAALGIATESLRLELGHSSVHVLEVIPGPVHTALQGESRLLPGFDRVMSTSPQGTPEVLARLIVRALERGRRRLVYPRPLAITYAIPALVRAAAPTVARKLVSPAAAAEALGEGRVVRSGSRGDDEVLSARRAWDEALQQRG
jgi:short-subunit dehydrogenase